MSYVLETLEEFERLERQSQHPNYDLRKELGDFDFSKDRNILDAGCGSGILSRYLASSYPQTKLEGVDLSKDRILSAQQVSAHLSNLNFKVSGLEQTPYESDTFDTIICRYVLQHLSVAQRIGVTQELFRILKPGGRLILIDADGLIANLWPTPPDLENMLSNVVKYSPVDLFVGRKLPAQLAQQGWIDVQWKIQTTECHGTSEADKTEISMMEERLTFAKSALVKILGTTDIANYFIKAYTTAMSEPGAVYFQNKFIIAASKPKSNFLKLVETEHE